MNPYYSEVRSARAVRMPAQGGSPGPKPTTTLMDHTRSQQLFERAKLSIPGGVNSPVRAYRSVGGTPPFIERGEGSHIFDADGNEYIDYVGSWGPLILGHRHPVILDALNRAMTRGTSFGAPTEQEIELAETVREMFPSIEMVRLVNSGTEATMSALRVARGFTHRDLTVKFEGCYHGHVDSLLVKAGSGVATLGLPDSPGVPKGFSDTTLTAPFNDTGAVEEAFRAHKDKIAAVIVEPVCGNMGCIPPGPGFLEALRRITTENDSLLIFDEVMTGFRVAPGGAQQLYNIKPDLTTLGKVIGGGLPIAAYGGRRDIMSYVAPSGPIYQAGTLSGNPLAVSAGLAAIRHLQTRPEIYDQLDQSAGAIAACAAGNISVNRVGSMMTWFFTDQPVIDAESAKTSNIKCFGKFFHAMLERGIYLPPSQYEALFVSAAHTDADIARTIDAARESFAIALS
jgi:glutamate-1-semialdehyde 2,1-aminomutase